MRVSHTRGPFGSIQGPRKMGERKTGDHEGMLGLLVKYGYLGETPCFCSLLDLAGLLLYTERHGLGSVLSAHHPILLC